MNRVSRIAALALLALILITSVGCSFIPQGIGGLFATKTPTATAIPIPPINITGCAFQSDCPDVVSLRSFYEGDLNPDSPVYVMFPFNIPVRVSLGWYALNQVALDENLKHLKFFFNIDGVPYEVNSMFKNGFYMDSDGSLTENPGLFMGVVLADWKVGIPHTIKYGYVIDSVINDGWESYDPQTVKYTIIAMPNIPPTVTSTATLTLTPLPTATPTPTVTLTLTPRPSRVPIINTPRPTSIPPTEPPSCNADSWIQITNSTGGQVTLNLNGPTSYTFYLSTGDTTLTVCPGSYSYSAYGCGGASNTGTINSGESHEFYCN